MIRLTRRRLLGSGAAALPGLALPALAHAQTRPARVSLLLDGIGPGLDPALLEQVVAPFLAAGLPVTCVADLAALTAPETADARLCDRLASLALRDPGLFDLALPIGKLPRPERYFQLRRAGELREAVLRAFRSGPAAGRSFPVVTLVDRKDDPNIDHTAFRGAGFRVHLAVGDGPWEPVLAGRGELVGAGGLWIALADPDLEARVAAGLATGQDSLLALSLANGQGLSGADMVQRASGVAELLAGAVARGAVQTASPAQLRLYAETGLPLDVALVVDPGLNPEEAGAALAFLRDLASQGVPLTLIGQAGTAADLPGTVHVCPPALPDGSVALPLPACLLTAASATAAEDLSVATHIGPEAAIWPAQGIDEDGRLRLTFRDLAGAGLETLTELSPLEDHVILIRGADLMQPIRREDLVRRLVEAALSGQVYFHAIPGLAAHLVEPEPVLSRLWSVRRRGVTDPARPPAPDAEERARLLDDARLAWRYIDRFTDADTGLCAGTVQQGPVAIVNREATMWDLASQLHGIRVAAQLALIPRDEAVERVRLLLQHLPTNDIDGLRLPTAMFRTDDLSPVARGFDVCDLGRFLVALGALVDAGLVDQAGADAILAGWDLAATVAGGHPFSHLGGSWRDTTLSHCTPYIRHGMDRWGFVLSSPHPGLAGGTATDRDIAFLYDVAAIGIVGVEPVLLDIVELGGDRQSGLIADVLFDAQLDWFETTGQLKCASEAPLNFPPWFSYQGLRLGVLGEAAWTVRGLGGAADYDTAEFRARAELLSTKSAYLWSANRAHPWCDRLLALIRDKTRIEGLGFSVGVFTSTMQAMPGYTDLNTNGVILTAIGHVLR